MTYFLSRGTSHVTLHAICHKRYVYRHSANKKCAGYDRLKYTRIHTINMFFLDETPCSLLDGNLLPTSEDGDGKYLTKHCHESTELHCIICMKTIFLTHCENLTFHVCTFLVQ